MQVSLYSRRVQEVEPVIEDWPFAVGYSNESQGTANLATADLDSSGEATSDGGGPTESVTLFSPELLNVNVMEAHLSRCMSQAHGSSYAFMTFPPPRQRYANCGCLDSGYGKTCRSSWLNFSLH